MSLTHKCGPGQIWDPRAGRCIPIVKGGTLYKTKKKASAVKKKRKR